MTIDEVNLIAAEIAEELAEERMNETIDALEEEAMDRMMAEHEQMMYAVYSYDLDAEAYAH